MKQTKKQRLLESVEALKKDIAQAIFFQKLSLEKGNQQAFLEWKDIESKLRNVLLDSLKKIKQL